MGTTISSESPLRAGIVGVGFLGKAMGREFGRHDAGELAAITDVSEQNLQEAAAEFGLSERSQYEDYEEMIAEEDLDALVITTPHALHAEQIFTALENDLHVLCEKPLCTDRDDANAIVERTEQSDRTVMLGYQRHLDAAYIETREFWHESDQDPSFITAEVTQDWINAVEGSWKSNADLSGGGQLYDTGSHLVDAVLWTTGLTPESVSADMLFHDDAERLDIQATLSVKFEEDAVATIAVSGDTPRVSENLRVWGDEGATYVEGRERNSRQFKRVLPDGDVIDPHIHRGTVQSKTEAFIESIQEGTEPPATVHDGLKSTALTEAAYEAAWTGERIDVDL